MLILVFSVNLGLLPSSGRGPESRGPARAHAGRLLHGAASRGSCARPCSRCWAGLYPHGAGQGAGRADRGRQAHVQERRHPHRDDHSAWMFGTLLGGAVVTETVFAWPGIGRLAIQSIYNPRLPGRAVHASSSSR